MESGLICRYKVQGITVDVMATGEDVLGVWEQVVPGWI